MALRQDPRSSLLSSVLSRQRAYVRRTFSFLCNRIMPVQDRGLERRDDPESIDPVHDAPASLSSQVDPPPAQATPHSQQSTEYLVLVRKCADESADAISAQEELRNLQVQAAPLLAILPDEVLDQKVKPFLHEPLMALCFRSGREMLDWKIRSCTHWLSFFNWALHGKILTELIPVRVLAEYVASIEKA